MERGESYEYSVLSDYERQLAVYALRFDERNDLADALEAVGTNRQIGQGTLAIILESVKKLADQGEYEAKRLMDSYRELYPD